MGTEAVLAGCGIMGLEAVLPVCWQGVVYETGCLWLHGMC